MRRLRLALWGLLGAILVGGYVVLWSLGLFGTPYQPRAKAVPSGDQEIAFIQAATSGASWERFVAGIHRVKKDRPDLVIDARGAFPEQSAAVPEVALSVAGSNARLWIRWYKLTSDAGIDKWVSELAARQPPPLALIGGGSSDRARDLARSLQKKADPPGQWKGSPPLLLVTTATADKVDRPDLVPPIPEPLLDIYPQRSFRFCFTNSQMAEAVWDFVWNRDELRPFIRPNLLLPGGIAHAIGGDLWGSLPRLYWGGLQPQPYLVHVVEWLDDPYSRDLANQFRNLFAREETPLLPCNSFSVPYSIGGVQTPNPREASVVERLTEYMPANSDERFLLILPAVDKPARRLLRSLALGAPRLSSNVVVVTGDSIPFNTLYRERQTAWNIQELPVPLVAFCHQNPVDWEDVVPRTPRAGGPSEPNGRFQTGTEDLLLNADIVQTLLEAAFGLGPAGNRAAPSAGGVALVADADQLNAEIKRRRAAYFGPDGNRRGGSGEYLVCLRPVLDSGRVLPRATLEVWTRQINDSGHKGWRRIKRWDVDY